MNSAEIKIDFLNKFRKKNTSEINEEFQELNKLTKHFEKQIQHDEINSLINKIIEKEFPFTESDLIESVKKILSSNYCPNFAFNKKNIQDISRVLFYSYKNMKKYGINSEEKLKKKLENINIKEKDIYNMYIDFDLIKREKSEKIIKHRNRNKFYANKNPKSFNSTGNLE